MSKHLSSHERFIQEYRISCDAAVGLVFVRTKEPYRVIEYIQSYVGGIHAKTKNIHCKLWNTIKGEHLYDIQKERFLPNTEGTTGATPEIISYLKGLYDKFILNQSDKKFKEIYILHGIHTILPNFNLVNLLSSFATELPKGDVFRQIVIPIPASTQIPNELEEGAIVLDFDLPTAKEIATEVFDIVIGSQVKRGAISKFTDIQKENMIKVLCGMTVQEASNALSRALIANKPLEAKEGALQIPYDAMLYSLLEVKTELIKKSEVLELLPSIAIDEVGGLAALKRWISLRKDCLTEKAKEFGVDTPKGIALFGPPGTGKSLVAKGIAGVLELPLINFDVSSVFNKFVGASESRVKSALKLLDAIAPCVVLIDEVDKLFQVGDSGDSGVSKRVLGSILSHMQESDAGIFWVMTANRVDNLPAELLRKGRLDELFCVTTPTDKEREEVLKIHLKKRKQLEIADLTQSIEASRDYTSAEIEAAVKEAVLEAYATKTPVTDEAIATQFKFMKPFSKVFEAQFTAMKTWAESNARMASIEDDIAVITPAKKTRNTNL